MDAITKLRQELRAFHNTGLKALREDLEAAWEDVGRLPGRLTWKSCPLSYRLGGRGSTDRDSGGYHTNAFTEAWDGLDGQDYLDELVVLREVEAEIQRREKKRKKGGSSSSKKFSGRKRAMRPATRGR